VPLTLRLKVGQKVKVGEHELTVRCINTRNQVQITFDFPECVEIKRIERPKGRFVRDKNNRKLWEEKD